MDVMTKILVAYEYDGFVWRWCVHTDNEAVLYEECDHVPNPSDRRRWGTAYTRWGARRQVERCIRAIREGKLAGFKEQVSITIKEQEPE